MADQVTPSSGSEGSRSIGVPHVGDENIDRALRAAAQLIANQLGARYTAALSDVAGTASGVDAAVINEIKTKLNAFLSGMRDAQIVSSSSTYSSTSTSTSSTYSSTSTSSTYSLSSSSSTNSSSSSSRSVSNSSSSSSRTSSSTSHSSSSSSYSSSSTTTSSSSTVIS